MKIIRDCIGFILMMAVCVAFLMALNTALEVIQHV